MNMQENARLILGLRAAGWDEKRINDFLLYIESGDEQYTPKKDRKNPRGGKFPAPLFTNTPSAF